MRVQQERTKSQDAIESGLEVRAGRRPSDLDPRNGCIESRKCNVRSKFPPEKRWLKAQLGRKWDDVYSDICRKFPNKGCKFYWEFHVLLKCSIQNGRIFDERGIEVCRRRWKYCLEIGYVHPDTGIFTAMPKPEKVEKRVPRPSIYSPVFGNDGEKFMLVVTKSGHWICRYKGHGDYRESKYDLLTKSFITHYRAYELYGKSIYVVSKRQITSKQYEKEIIKYGSGKTTHIASKVR